MTEPAFQRNLMNATPTPFKETPGNIPVQHVLLDEMRCEKFAQWLDGNLVQLEQRLESFTTSCSLISSLR